MYDDGPSGRGLASDDVQDEGEMQDGGDVEDEGRGVDVADVGRRRAGSAACGRQRG